MLRQRVILMINALGLIFMCLGNDDLHMTSTKPTKTFEDMVTSFLKTSESSLTELEDSFNEKWEKSEGPGFIMCCVAEQQAIPTPPIIENHKDGLEFAPFIYPLPTFELLTHTGAVQGEVEFASPAPIVASNLHQLIPDIEYEDIPLSTFQGHPENAYHNLFFYSKPPESNQEYQGGVYIAPISETGDKKYKVKKKKFIHPLPAIVHSLLERWVDSKLFWKWSGKKLTKAIYPYYRRPKIRYPFYDKEGNGKLLYGYGSDEVYQYDIFRPLQGYLK